MNDFNKDKVRGIFQKLSLVEELEAKNRLKRLLMLDAVRTIEIDTGILPEPGDSIDPFVREAAEAYVHGLYRSCIFCCATAVHQILMEVLLHEGDVDIQALTQLQRLRFEEAIDEIEKTPKLQTVAEDADWLRKTSNRVAAHSCYVTTGRAMSQEQLRFEIETMIRDARTLINLLEPEDKARVESSTVTYKDRAITFGQALKTKDRHGAEVVWRDLQFYVIPALALEAYKRLYRVMKRLQIYVITRYHTRAPYETVK